MLNQRPLYISSNSKHSETVDPKIPIQHSSVILFRINFPLSASVTLSRFNSLVGEIESSQLAACPSRHPKKIKWHSVSSIECESIPQIQETAIQSINEDDAVSHNELNETMNIRNYVQQTTFDRLSESSTALPIEEFLTVQNDTKEKDQTVSFSTLKTQGMDDNTVTISSPLSKRLFKHLKNECVMNLTKMLRTPITEHNTWKDILSEEELLGETMSPNTRVFLSSPVIRHSQKHLGDLWQLMEEFGTGSEFIDAAVSGVTPDRRKRNSLEAKHKNHCDSIKNVVSLDESRNNLILAETEKKLESKEKIVRSVNESFPLDLYVNQCFHSFIIVFRKYN